MREIADHTDHGKPDETRVVDATLGDLRALVREELADLAPAAPPEVLTTEQACQVLQVSRATLARLVLAGHVRQRRLGDSPRYLRAELLEDLRGAR